MFQSDDLNIDEDIFNDAFELENEPSTSSSNIKDYEQPTKKLCIKKLPDPNTQNILTILKPKSSNLSVESLDKNRRVVQRKFPGPAGILPEFLNKSNFEENSDCMINKKVENNEIVCSQFTEDAFAKGPWSQMLNDWFNLQNKYTISWTKTKALSKQLIGQKTPFLAAVIQNIECSSKDPMVLLKDKTDEIQATLLHEVWDKYFEVLNAGSVIVLKQTGVLSTLKKHYLAITTSNLVTIYSDQQTQIKTTKIQPLTASDILKTIKDVKKNYETQKILQKTQPAAQNNPYFKSPNLQSNKFNLKPQQNTICDESAAGYSSKKFNFKSRINLAKSENSELNKENGLENVENEKEILTQVLDGLDADSLFDDF